MSEVGCYTLYPYCDLPGHEDELFEWHMGSMTGHTYRQCVRKAKRLGWRRLSRGEDGRRWACPRHPKGGPFQRHPNDHDWTHHPLDGIATVALYYGP